MRIHFSTIWALSGTMFSLVAAQGAPPKFTFDGTSFVGQDVPDHQSSVFEYNSLANGRDFKWTQSGDPVEVVRVDLMNTASSSILFWCPKDPDDTCTTTEGFKVTLNEPQPGGSIQLSSEAVNVLHQFLGAVLFFRVDWKYKGAKRDIQVNSSYSQDWAIVDNAGAASSMYRSYATQMTAGAAAAREPGPSPTFISTATHTESTGAAASTASGQITSSAAASSGKKTRGLTTGAIVGIVVGTVGGLILISVIAGCFCFRRRRDAGVERGGSRGVQDIIAEKEAHASILDRDQPDTPYSEQNSQQPLHRGLGLAGRNESGVDLGIGQAMSGGASVRTESLHTVAAGGNDRNSAMYSSLGGGAASSAHGTPVMGSGPFAGSSSSPPTQPHTPSMSVHERSSMMGSPVLRASSQLDRSLSPYRDNAGQQYDYGQHQQVVDDADLVQQEHDSNTVRSPSSIYSTNPLDDTQPISPESARENAGAAVGGGSGGASSHGPPGHGRSTTPSGISGQYAHLVEEGMTDDEIRRLEEEERALDEAIEAQAGTAGKKR